MTTSSSSDPRTGNPAASVAVTSEAELESVVARATDAAADVAAVSPDVRRGWLYAIADALETDRTELARIADWETALGVERLTGEVTRTADQLRFYADVAVEGSYLAATIDHATATTPTMVRVRQPVGPVAVFGASNFPFAFSVLGNDTASALAAGCPVVVKAHPAHAMLSQRVFDLAVDALAAAGAPAGALGMVSGFEIGGRLVMHPGIAAVAFTGSEAGGMHLWRMVRERDVVIPVFAEMGTVNPVAVTPAAAHDIDGVAAGFVASFTLGSGQFCTKPGLMFAPRSAGAPTAVARALDAAAPDPVMLTHGIAAGVTAAIDELQRAGATVVTQVGSAGRGWSAPAVVLSAPIEEIRPGSRLLEETFGAVAVVVEYDDPADVPRALASMQGALAGSVFAAGADPLTGPFVAAMSHKVGRVLVNGWPTGVAFTWGQHHGGPWPATSEPTATSVGASALDRFVRPVTFQGVPDDLVPPAVQEANPWRVPQRVDGVAAR